MKNSEQIATRYLLGELSESERVALEEKYFSNLEIFDEITKVECELVDNYVRGRLSLQVRERFEQFYLAHPERRERVMFAVALATRLDQVEGAREVPAEPVGVLSWWRRLEEQLRGRSLAPAFSVALALMLLIGGIWLFAEARRVRHALAQTQAALTTQELRERELQQQVIDERFRADEMAAELESLRNQLAAAQTTAPDSNIPAFVSFLVTVGSTRTTDSGPQNTLVIPTGTTEVRFRVSLKEHNYPTYIVVLHQVGGEDIFSRQNVTPGTTKPAATFTLSVPAKSFNTGDYVLTLKAASSQGDVEDLSKTIFRVEKR